MGILEKLTDMKVYYDVTPIPPIDLTGMLGNPDVENSISKNINNLIEKTMENISLKFKYRVMWELRSLENEIYQENGIIIIKNTQWHTKGFTQELTDKIMDILKSVDLEKW